MFTLMRLTATRLTATRLTATRLTAARLTAARLTVALRMRPDRGDTPVPSAIIIAGLAVLALVLVGWVFYLGGEFMGQVESQLPEPPAPVPGN